MIFVTKEFHDNDHLYDMNKNMSKADGIIRIMIALVIIGLWYFGLVGGVLLTVLSVVAVIFIVTGFINFCPLYSVFGWRTRKK